MVSESEQIHQPETEAAYWIHPPRFIHAILTIIVTVGILQAASYPLILFVPCWVLAGFPLVVVYLTRISAKMAATRRGSVEQRHYWKGWWAIFPACVLVVVVALWTRAPFLLRFEASRTALEAEARRLLATQPTQENNEMGSETRPRYLLQREIGAYTVVLADVDYPRGHVYFSIGTVVRPGGLVFFGTSTSEPEEGYRVSYLPREWGLFAYP